jgi:hypothetical protein
MSAFLEEIALQCRSAIIAGQDLARCYQSMKQMLFSRNTQEPGYSLETELFWYSYMINTSDAYIGTHTWQKTPLVRTT